MKVTVKKWGKSLALGIPKPLAENMGVTNGTVVEVDIVDGHLVATLVPASEYGLADLLGAITSENTHNEIDYGIPVGNEVL